MRQISLPDEIADWYRAGWSLRRIANELQRRGLPVSYWTVCRHLMKAGIPRRPKGWTPGCPIRQSMIPEWVLQDIADWYIRCQWGSVRISRELAACGYPLGATCVVNTLHRLGIPLRPAKQRWPACVECGKPADGRKRCNFHFRLLRSERQTAWRHQRLEEVGSGSRTQAGCE